MRRLLLISLFLSLQVATQKVFAQCATPNKDGSVTLLTFPNSYLPGTTASLAAGSTLINVGAGIGTANISAGDLLVVMQMQGADIAPENSDRYGDDVVGGFGNGTVAANFSAGVFEFAVATNSVVVAVGGTISLQSPLVNSYTNANYVGPVPGPESHGQRRYQVIRVPQNLDVTLGATIQPPTWNGSVGGVLIIEARGNFSFAGNAIDASGSGFRGGGGRALNGVPGSPGGPNDFLQLSTFNSNGSKGEGLAGTPRFINNAGVLLDNVLEGYREGSVAKGAPGNAGGGGTDSDPTLNQENTGGGGGGNGGIGGKGGNNWPTGLNPGGGEPGALFAGTPQVLVMGGGGGAGSSNDGTGTLPAGLSSSGAAGGGIIIIRAKTFLDAGTITANGANADNSVLFDGSGGGGAGGSILVIGAVGLSNITASANGGTGGSNTPGAGVPHGPGGGGGGGLVYSSSALNAISIAGGAAGLTDGGLPFGATAGADGLSNTAILDASLPLFYQVCGATLPIKLTDFTGVAQGSSVLLKWATAQEFNSDYMLVEKSANGRDWEVATRVAAAVNSNTVRNYQTVDGRPSTGKNYYKLKLVDKSGQVSYSSIVIVNFNGKGFGIILAPNPNGGKFGIYSDKALSPSAVVKIVSSTGQIMMQRKIGNLQAVTFEGLVLAKGVYTAVITDDNGTTTKKFIVQ